MCIILVGNVTKEQHEAARVQNGDGFSLFTQKQGLIKAPTAKQVKEALGDFGIWHYRIATSGDRKSVQNIHPFPVCGGKYLLYHNGVLGEGLGKKSDTHALANTLQNVSPRSAETILQSLAGGRNRFVMADAKDPKKLYLYGEWVADAGVIMSHRLTVPVRTYNYSDTAYGTSYPANFTANFTRDIGGYSVGDFIPRGERE